MENDKKVKKALEILQPRASFIVSPHLAALGFHIHCGSNYFCLHREVLDQAQELFFFMDLAGACQQRWNNQEHNSGVIADVITAACSSSLQLSWAKPSSSPGAPGHGVPVSLSLWAQAALTSQCWTPRGHQRTRPQERLLLSSPGSWLGSAPPVCCCARFSPGLGTSYGRIGPDWISAQL